MTADQTLHLGLLLLVACLVAMVTRRIGFPYAIGLVVAGIALGLGGLSGPLVLTRDLIFTVLLPPLVFEGALHLGWRPFRREAPLVLAMAFVGTGLAAALVAVGMHGLVGWGWQASALFGALIAATDPVSVLALMKEQGAERRLRFLMEAESLVNDGAAAVLFAVAVLWIEGSVGGAGSLALTTLTIAGGGVLCGLVVGGLLLVVAGPSDDPLVETTLTLLAAYGSYLVAERAHASGVLATLTAGMLVGNWGRRRLSEEGAAAMVRWWDFAAFLANSVVFLLIGARTASQPLLASLWPAAVATVVVLGGRIVAVYPITRLFDGTRWAVDASTKGILFWGGLRGALALALALGAPASLPEHDALIAVSFAVVAFSIFVQGLTVPRLLRLRSSPTD